MAYTTERHFSVQETTITKGVGTTTAPVGLMTQYIPSLDYMPTVIKLTDIDGAALSGATLKLLTASGKVVCDVKEMQTLSEAVTKAGAAAIKIADEASNFMFGLDMGATGAAADTKINAYVMLVPHMDCSC